MFRSTTRAVSSARRALFRRFSAEQVRISTVCTLKCFPAGMLAHDDVDQERWRSWQNGLFVCFFFSSRDAGPPGVKSWLEEDGKVHATQMVEFLTSLIVYLGIDQCHDGRMGRCSDLSMSSNAEFLWVSFYLKPSPGSPSLDLNGVCNRC